MPIILEDGTGVAGANSYADLTMFAAHAAGNLYADAYTAATDDKRTAALIMASRQIDAQVEFWGYPLTITQGMDWPRQARNVAAYAPHGAWPLIYGPAYPDLCTPPKPARLQTATCELALALLGFDYVADDQSKGVRSVNIGQGAVAITFDPSDRKAPMPQSVVAMLMPFGDFRFCKSTVRVVRVQ